MQFNPLVDEIGSLSEAQLDQKINDLSRKYFQTHNPAVQQQISAILDMYKEELTYRRAKEQLKNQQNGNSDLDNLINIS